MRFSRVILGGLAIIALAPGRLTSQSPQCFLIAIDSISALPDWARDELTLFKPFPKNVGLVTSSDSIVAPLLVAHPKASPPPFHAVWIHRTDSLHIQLSVSWYSHLRLSFPHRSGARAGSAQLWTDYTPALSFSVRLVPDSCSTGLVATRADST
jgi:hypothetical protein